MRIIINSLFRSLLKNKSNLFINLLGLVIGVTSFLFISAWIISEKSYDRFWEGADQMYRVELAQNAQGKELLNTAKNYTGAGPVLQNELPSIEAATYLDKDIITVFTPKASIQDVDMFFTDSSFFKVFPCHIACEDPDQLFADIHSGIISRSLARKLFGTDYPVNQSFKLNEGWEFYVTGVFDDVPSNSHIRFDLILQHKALFYYMNNYNYETGELDNSRLNTITTQDPYSQSQWGGAWGYTYIRLKPGADIQQVRANYASVIAPCIEHIGKNNETVRFEFKPVTQIHLFSNIDAEIGKNGSYFKIWAFALIGFLLVLTSLLNYVNISVASSINRSAARGVQRVLGANRRHLFFELLTESFLFNAAAGAIGLVFAILFLKNGRIIGGFEIFPISIGLLALIISGFILTGTLFGSVYPFVFIVWKMLNPSGNLKKQLSGNSMTSVKALVVFQFAVSIFLIIGTLVIFRQLKFMQNTETGMDMEQTMVSFSPMTMIKKPDQLTKLETFRNEVQKIPGVKGFTTAEIVAGKNYSRSNNKVWLQGGEENKNPFSIAHVDYDYFDFFSIDLLSGSLFNRKLKRDGDEVIISQSACNQLGVNYDEAIGHLLVVGDAIYRIIGVVNDYHHLSLKDKIKPVIYMNSLYWHRTVGYYFIRISPQNRPSTIAMVTQLWNDLYPQEGYHYKFLDDSFNEAYNDDNNFGKIYMTFALLTIFIALMGLLALAKFASKARIKEIGIRKVNGARTGEVISMLNRDFIKWVGVAFLIAIPVAWYIMHIWLENFAYKTKLSWWVFALAGILALGVALLTVSFQSWKAAVRNPVEALKYE